MRCKSVLARTVSRVIFFIISINASIITAQTYVQSNCILSTSIVNPGDLDQSLIGLEIEMTDGAVPHTLTGMVLELTGNSSIDHLRVYSTGTSSTFTTSKLLTTTSSPDANLNLTTLSETLSTGINYFWIAADLSDSAPTGTKFDATCTQITINGSGTSYNHVPTIQSPTGYKLIPHSLILKGMAPADHNFAVTTLIDGDVYFYGFNQDYKDPAFTDLDGDSQPDWGTSSKVTTDSTGLISIADTSNSKIIAETANTLYRNLGLNTGNTAFSFEVRLSINNITTAGNGYDASWGYTGNVKRDATGSMFLIADDNIQLGDQTISSDNDGPLNNMLDLNNFRYSYVPSGNNDAYGDIYIYRNDNLLGVFPGRNLSSSKIWFGDWTSAMNGGYTIEYLSLTPGAYAPDPNLSPVIGITFTKVGNTYSWAVETEVSVKEYQLVDTKTGKVLTVIKAAGLTEYSATLDYDTEVKLVVVDHSNYSQSFLPENPENLSTVLNIKSGWNLLSIPGNNADLSEVRTISNGPLWTWDGNKYVIAESIQAGQGFWFYAADEYEIVVGSEPSEAPVKLNKGWTLVGPKTNILAPEGYTIYSWVDSYQQILDNNNMLIVGQGYWIHSSEENDLLLK